MHEFHENEMFIMQPKYTMYVSMYNVSAMYNEIYLYSFNGRWLDINNKLMDEMIVQTSSFKSDTQSLISAYFLTQ